MMKCAHTVSNDPTERLFKSGYGFHMTWQMLEDQHVLATSRLIFGQ